MSGSLLLHSLDRGVLGVEPRSLDVSGLLGISSLVGLSSESGDALDSLLLKWPRSAESTVLGLDSVELFDVVLRQRPGLESVGQAVGGFPPKFVVAGLVLVDHRSESALGPTHRSVNEGQFGDVVFMDHAEDWLLSVSMHGGVHEILLSGTGLLIESVGGDHSGGVVLGHSVNSRKGLGDSGGGQGVDGWLIFSFLN